MECTHFIFNGIYLHSVFYACKYAYLAATNIATLQILLDFKEISF